MKLTRFLNTIIMYNGVLCCYKVVEYVFEQVFGFNIVISSVKNILCVLVN